MLCSSFNDKKERYVFICIILFFQVIQTISILLANNPLRSILMTCDWVMLLIVRAAGKICFTTQMSFPWEIKPVVASRNVGCFLRLFKIDTSLQNIRRVGSSLQASSSIWASETSLARTRERAAKPRGAEERSPSLARSREARFACPNRRACSQAKLVPLHYSWDISFCFPFISFLLSLTRQTLSVSSGNVCKTYSET